MFDWMKGSSPSKVRLEKPRNRSFFWKKRGTSMVSLSSIFDHETSMNVELEDTFSTSKDSKFSRKSKRVTRVIVSMFQRRPKDVSVDDKRKNRLTANLLDDSAEDDVDQAEGNKFLDGEGSKKAKRHFKGPAKWIFLQERKQKLFKRKPLDDYAKRKLQISRGFEWDSTSTSSFSSSSLLNEGAAFSASSPITKANSTEKNPGISSNVEHDRVAVQGKTLLFTYENVESLFKEILRSEEDLKRPVDGDSSLLSDSGICVSGNNCYLNDSSDRSRSSVDIVNKSVTLKFSCSVNCLVHLAADAKSCRKCALNCDVSRNHRETRARGLPVELSSRIAKHSEESRVIKRSRSAGCIPSYIKSPLKNSERSSPTATSHEKPVNVKNLDVDSRSNGQFKYRRLIEESLPTRTRLWISKSANELLDEDSLCCQDEVAEFSSLTDLPCSSLLHSGTDDDRGSNSNKFPVHEEAKGTLDEESATESTEVQHVSTDFGYETESDESRSFNSCNSSYVITMYV